MVEKFSTPDRVALSTADRDAKVPDCRSRQDPDVKGTSNTLIQNMRMCEEVEDVISDKPNNDISS